MAKISKKNGRRRQSFCLHWTKWPQTPKVGF